MSGLFWNCIEASNATLFHLGDDAVSAAELFGFLTGGACVWLAMRGRIANFPVGIANCLFFLLLFMAARLWANAALQLVFIALGVAGWWRWAKAGHGDQANAPSHASLPVLTGCLAFVLVATIVLTPLLAAADDATPFWDALTTSLSLAAQWLLNARKIETWWFWIVADCIYVPLYVSQGLFLTATVYLAFLAMCFGGIREWRRSLGGRPPVARIGRALS